MKTIWHRKRRWLLGMFFVHDIVYKENDGRGYTRSRKRIELLHDMMERRDDGQLKDLVSDGSR